MGLRSIAMRGGVVLSLISATAGWAAEPVVLTGTLPPEKSGSELRTESFAVGAPSLPEPAVLKRQREERRTAPDQVFAPDKRSAPAGQQYVWRTVLLIYPSIDVVTTASGVATRFTYTMSQGEIEEAKRAMISAQAGISSGSNGEALQAVTTVVVGRTLTSLARVGEDQFYWPDAAVTGPEIQAYCAGGKADSAMVYWPSRNRQTGQGVNNGYWGLAYTEIAGYTYNVGYSTVANIVSPEFPGYYPGEVFIHEWLHPTGGYFEKIWGYHIPNLDAAGSYRPCPACANYALVQNDGYMAFYRDFMRGTVWNPAAGRYEGISPAAWQSGSPTNTLVARAAAADWELFE